MLGAVERKFSIKANETKNVICGLDYLEFEKLLVILTYSCLVFCLRMIINLYIGQNISEFHFVALMLLLLNQKLKLYDETEFWFQAVY